MSSASRFVDPAALPWRATGHEGVSWKKLHYDARTGESAVLLRFAPEASWMLPGLWQVVFALGVFASCRFLPRAMLLVGGWYLATALACLVLARGPYALSPWAMGAPFGIGQFLVAAILQLAAWRGRDDR